MENEINTPDHLPDDNKEDLKRAEDLKAAAKRREEYSRLRDLQATEDNEAIARRSEREKEKQDTDNSL
jgi:hypothetical protein